MNNYFMKHKKSFTNQKTNEAYRNAAVLIIYSIPPYPLLFFHSVIRPLVQSINQSTHQSDVQITKKANGSHNGVFVEIRLLLPAGPLHRDVVF